MRVSGVLIALIVLVGTGCGESRPSPKSATSDPGVPANFLSDARLHGGDDAKAKPIASEPRPDPTQPYLTKVGETAAPAETGSGSASSGGAKGVVSKAECARVMDRYIELEIATNPALEGVPADVVDQAKQMAREKHGDAPCTATRAQYACAMAATSTAAWQRCMK